MIEQVQPGEVGRAAARREHPRSAAMILPNFIAHPTTCAISRTACTRTMCAPASTRGRHGRRRRPVALDGGDVAAERAGQKPLARRPDKQRPSELAEFVQPRQRLVGVAGLLRESRDRDRRCTRSRERRARANAMLSRSSSSTSSPRRVDRPAVHVARSPRVCIRTIAARCRRTTAASSGS
jgi:hypothetical protein